MRTARFYYDLVCPYSYLESHAVTAAEDAGELSVEWLPFELNPAPEPMFGARDRELRADWNENVYPYALEREIEIHLPRVQPRSTLPLAACFWATTQHKLRAFRGALYEAYFCEGEDISTESQIVRAAAHAELNPAEALAAAYAPDNLARIHSIRAEAKAQGVPGVPTIVTAENGLDWGLGGVARALDGALAPVRGPRVGPREIAPSFCKR